MKNKLQIPKVFLSFFNSIWRSLKGLHFCKKQKPIINIAEPTDTTPFIICIKNNTNKVIKNFRFLDAARNINKQNHGIVEGVDVKMFISDIPYEAMLWQIINKPFYTYKIQIITDKPEQFPCVVHERNGNPNGVVSITPLLFMHKPTQFQTNIVSVDYNCLVDAFTRLTFDRLEPEVNLQVYLYPTVKK
jgi:hypothetical protein